MRWRRWVVGGAVALGVVAIALVVLLATSDATRTQLTVIGGTLEAIGIGLVALDFWAPAAARGLRWLRAWDVGARLRRVMDWLAGRKRTRVSASFTMPWESAGAITSKLTSPRVTTFDDVSDRLQAITDRITTIEGENARAHGRLGNEMVEREERLRADVQEWIARSKDQYLPWRIVGLVVALSGTVVLAAANLAG
ncbi:MAG: hypothetical protein ACRDNE_04965 [Gaiellaceae bacterium]